MSDNNKVQVLRPGFLIGLSTSVTGGIRYEHRNERTERDTDGREIKSWESERVITDREDYEAATKARNAASAAVRKVCAKTGFGLICSESRESELRAALVEARAIVNAYMARAGRKSTVTIYVIKGRIAADDREAGKAVAQEMRSILEEMERNVYSGNAEDLRKVVSQAQEIARALQPEKAAIVTDAVKEMRGAARAFTKRIEKDGEDSARVIADQPKKALQIAKDLFSNLDLEDAPIAPAVPSVESADRFAALTDDSSTGSDDSTDLSVAGLAAFAPVGLNLDLM